MNGYARERRIDPPAELLALILLLALFGSNLSCGRPGAPVPPARFSERVSNLAGIQRGAAIVLSWSAPPLVTDASTRSYVAAAEIYRLVERIDQQPVLDQEEYDELSELVGILDRDDIERQSPVGRLRFTDPLNLSLPGLATIRLRYAVRYVNKRGQRTAFSNTVAFEPVAMVALPPTDLQITFPKQSELVLTWNPPQANADRTTPPSILGYNVYRRVPKRDEPADPLNERPLSQARFLDSAFHYETAYVYFVRSVSQGTTGWVESANSQELSVTPKDTFPPAPPKPVSIASANRIVSLFWPTSPELDVIGYNIYRADSADAPPESWVKLNDDPITAVTFHDDTVTVGETYFYRVTAVDRFKNESGFAVVVRETAQP